MPRWVGGNAYVFSSCYRRLKVVSRAALSPVTWGFCFAKGAGPTREPEKRSRGEKWYIQRAPPHPRPAGAWSPLRPPTRAGTVAARGGRTRRRGPPATKALAGSSRRIPAGNRVRVILLWSLNRSPGREFHFSDAVKESAGTQDGWEG